MKHLAREAIYVIRKIYASCITQYELQRLWLFGSLLVMAGCAAQITSVPTPTATPIPPERIAAGLAVYKALYCGVCHTLEAAGTAGTFGPPHNGMGETARQRIQEPGYTGTAETAADYIRESIIEPQIYLVPDYALTPHQMPIFNYLEDEQIEALVLMLLAQ